MADVTIYHNPNCSSSRHAVDTAKALGVDADIVQYLKTPPDGATLRELIGNADDPAADFVRRDNTWKELGLTDDDVASVDQVVGVLVEHPKLLQRPILVRDGGVIIGRPKDRATTFLGG